LIDIEDGRTTEGEHTIGDLVTRVSRRDIKTPLLSNMPLLSAALCNLRPRR
jgi:ketopantoate reductase